MSTLSQLKRALPKNTVLSGSENTRPFECDGLSVYRQEPLAVVLPNNVCLLYTSPSPRDLSTSRMPSSA